MWNLDHDDVDQQTERRGDDHGNAHDDVRRVIRRLQFQLKRGDQQLLCGRVGHYTWHG